MQAAQRFVSAVALTVLSASSFAATTVYTSSASFLANVAAGAYTETFTGLSVTPPSVFTNGTFSFSVSAPSGLYGSGDFLGTNQVNEALTVNFTSGNVTAVGGNFYATNISDAFQAVSMTVTLNDGTSSTFTPTSAADSYRGFTSTAFITSLVISAPGGSLYSGVDNLTVGVAAVPEPASWLMMGLGVAGLLVARRRTA